MPDLDTTRQAVGNALRDRVEELPPAFDAVTKLLRLTRDDAAGVGTVSRVIETEPALAVKVLRIVNSAYYGFRRQVRSIQRAVTILGFSAVREIALHLLVYDGLVRQGGRNGFDRAHFWQHSLLVAILSRDMGQRLGHPDPDSLYAAGLLHDLGKIILESRGRVSYSRFLTATASSGNTLRDDEGTFFGATHDQVGAVVCEDWELPEIVCRAQALHHGPIGPGLSELQAQEVAVVAMADFIAWTQGIGSVRDGGGPILVPEALERVDLARLDLPRLLEKADREIKEISGFYQVRFPSSGQLRANLVLTAIGLGRVQVAADVPREQTPRGITAPHQSLDPDAFVPATLAALQEELGFGRLLLMQIEPRRRSLAATHLWPESVPPEVLGERELDIADLSGELVRCLRERRPVMLRRLDDYVPVVDLLVADEAAVVPVFGQGRLLGLLWLCPRGNDTVDIGRLNEAQLVARELGVALERARLFARERRLAEMDGLTRLYNRAMVDRILERTWRQAGQTGRGFALGLMDVDRFKSFNDRFGHQAGDDVLRIVADTLSGLTRPGDFLGRYGGEEFLFLLPDTGRAGALQCAERMRAAIEERGRILLERFPGHALTVSVGLAVYDARLANPARLVDAADQAMYGAKNSGRNRVVAAWDLRPARASGVVNA